MSPFAVQQTNITTNTYYSPYMENVGDLFNFTSFTFTTGGATGRDGPSLSSFSSGNSITTITNSLLGAAALTSSTTPTFGDVDQGYWFLTLPWSITYNGSSYNSLYVDTNSLITFGGISVAQPYSGNPISPTFPAFNKIMIQAANNSCQRIYYGTEGIAPNRTYRIRFEGTNFITGNLGSPNMVWEATFYENNIGQIDIQIGTMARSNGLSGTYSSTSLLASGFTTANTGYRVIPPSYTIQPWFPTYFSVSNGVQYWYAPKTGSYTVRAAGAAGQNGYYSNKCRGIIIESTVTLIKGMLYKIAVGQMGRVFSTGSGGGGGGTFLTEYYDVPVVVAGGGGGSRISSVTYTAEVPSSDGQSTTSGGNASDGTGPGGNNGYGGTGSIGGYGGGGGGVYTNGSRASLSSGFGYSGIGAALTYNGRGGDTATSAFGGFGGGGGTHGNTGGGGGGGGYSGGGGSSQIATNTAGGGGGSYSQSPITVIGYNQSHGYLTITKN